MKIETFSDNQLKVITLWTHPTVSKKYSAVIADGSIRSGKTMCMSRFKHYLMKGVQQ